MILRGYRAIVYVSLYDTKMLLRLDQGGRLTLAAALLLDDPAPLWIEISDHDPFAIWNSVAEDHRDNIDSFHQRMFYNTYGAIAPNDIFLNWLRFCSRARYLIDHESVLDAQVKGFGWCRLKWMDQLSRSPTVTWIYEKRTKIYSFEPLHLRYVHSNYMQDYLCGVILTCVGISPALDIASRYPDYRRYSISSDMFPCSDGVLLSGVEL